MSNNSQQSQSNGQNQMQQPMLQHQEMPSQQYSIFTNPGLASGLHYHQPQQGHYVTAKTTPPNVSSTHAEKESAASPQHSQSSTGVATTTSGDGSRGNNRRNILSPSSMAAAERQEQANEQTTARRPRKSIEMPSALEARNLRSPQALNPEYMQPMQPGGLQHNGGMAAPVQNAMPMQGMGANAPPMYSETQINITMANAPQMQPSMAVPLVSHAQQMMPAGGYCSGDVVLSQSEHLVIREKVRLSSVLFGIERPNVYQIENPRLPGFPVMSAQERSGCCARQCLPAGTRGYTMELLVNGGGGQGPLPYLKFKKPCACACCCCCRPHMEIIRDDSNNVGQLVPGSLDGQGRNVMTSGRASGSNGNSLLLARVDNPCVCCGMKYRISNGNGVPLLVVSGTFCQPGMFCRCPCGPCRTIEFNVFRAGTESLVAKIRKTWGGFVRDVVSDAGLYEVEFLDLQDPRLKAMVVATALFLSEEYFTRGGMEQRDHSVLGMVAAQA